MQESPFPCFFGINETQNLGADNLELERTSVTLGLEACSPEAHPLESYSLVKRFLQAHTVKTRYDLFRSAIEKLLLWCLLLARKPIVSLNEVEIRQFMDFCLRPPSDWVASCPEKRLKRASNTRASKLLIVNPQWKPFRPNTKRIESIDDNYRSSGASSLAGILSVVNQFYWYLCFEDVVSKNPATALHDSRIYTSNMTLHEGQKHFSEPEWELFVSTCVALADVNSDFERKLFLMMTIYYIHLQPVELGYLGRILRVRSLFQRENGTYGLSVELVPHLQEIILPAEYVAHWVARFRSFLGTHDMPISSDPTPLISTKSGRRGISAQHANVIFKSICNEIISEIESRGGFVPADSAFRIATLQWLRETRLVRSAESMSFDELYPSIRGTTMDTAFARFFAWQPTYNS